jgi:hypothetical protein
MSMVVNLANNIRIEESKSATNNNTQEINKYFPKMLWVLRDFTLKLENTEGTSISMNQ